MDSVMVVVEVEEYEGGKEREKEIK